ncbi:hypothetical protein C7E12_19135, partial [Stenotrophomonas maltophilia]
RERIIDDEGERGDVLSQLFEGVDVIGESDAGRSLPGLLAPAQRRRAERPARCRTGSGDFRRVRDDFEQLNREFRERIIDDEGERGDVLSQLFEGVDVIGESDAGRS